MYTQRLDADDLQLSRRDYDPPAFYAHTKRCEVILTELWAERLRGTGVSVHSMHPGWADTPGVQTSLPRFRKLMRPLLRDADQAADTVVWLVTAPSLRSVRGCSGTTASRARSTASRGRKESGGRAHGLWDECARLCGWHGDQEPAEPASTGATPSAGHLESRDERPRSSDERAHRARTSTTPRSSDSIARLRPDPRCGRRVSTPACSADRPPSSRSSSGSTRTASTSIVYTTLRGRAAVAALASQPIREGAHRGLDRPTITVAERRRRGRPPSSEAGGTARASAG